MAVEIGKKIRKKRKDLGLTQVELSSRAGITQSTLSYIEKDMKRPQFDTIFAICQVLGISVLELLTLDETPRDKQHFEETFAVYHSCAKSEALGNKAVRFQSFDKYLYDLYISQTSSFG